MLPWPAVAAGHRVERSAAWLAANVDGRGPFDVPRIAGGRSNLTFAVTGAAGGRFVLRRPPLGHVLATAHDMAREHRDHRRRRRRPPCRCRRRSALCTDETVNGAPVLRDGLRRRRRARHVAEAATRCRRRLRGVEAASTSLDVLADLHAVDIDAIGLGDLGRARGLHRAPARRGGRQQWDALQDPRAAGIDEVVADTWRRGCRRSRAWRSPTATTASATASPIPTHRRIAAVLDWELCTLGDPLADVGYLGVLLDRRRRVRRPAATTRPGAGGFPTFADVLERYAARTGRDLSRHRLLRRVPVVAAGGDQRGRLRPLPARRDGRLVARGRRARRVP